MEERLFREAIDLAVEREFETPVDLMPGIRSKLSVRKTPVKPVSTLRWATIVFVTLFVSVATVYAISSILRQAMQQDEGISYVDSRGLGQLLDLSTTIDGMVLNLEWAYADTERISLGYTVQLPEGMSTEGFYPQTYLIDDEGHVFAQTSSQISTEGSLIGFVQDYTSQPALQDILNLRLVGRFELMQIDQTIEFGPVNLKFSVPFTPDRRLLQPVTVEKNGIGMTLNQVVVTPSKIMTEFCYSGEIDPERRLEINWRLEIAGETIDIADSFKNSMYGDEPLCSTYSLDVALYEVKGTWKITVQELVDQWTGYFESPDLMQQYSEGAEWETILAELEKRGLLRRVTGPWVFEFELEGDEE